MLSSETFHEERQTLGRNQTSFVYKMVTQPYTVVDIITKRI